MTARELYRSKLLDPRWQKKRLEIFQRDDWKCGVCGATDKTLHVHHRKYISCRDPWDYPSNLLIALCEPCHQAEQETYEELVVWLIDTLEYAELLSPDVQSLRDLIINLVNLPYPVRHSLDALLRLTSEPAAFKSVLAPELGETVQ
jgi:hypothetical protein